MPLEHSLDLEGTNQRVDLKQGIDLRVRPEMWFQSFGQVINRAGKITDFSLK